MEFKDDFESDKWEDISTTNEGSLFLEKFIVQDIDFYETTDDRSDSIKGMEFEIEKFKSDQ